jgi:glycosyltransferase involved in cell wall biosynthesis
MQLGNPPVVSIIIIVFNGAKYILNAIGSVFDQTHQDVEIVVVDDGSTDNTKGVLESLIKEDKIRYFYQENKGTSGAYNTGVGLARGKYVKFLDCDDVLYPRQLELQVNHLQNRPENIISVTDYEIEFENKNKKTIKIRLRKKEDQLEQFIEGNPCPGHTILISRALILQAGGYDEELINREDTYLWIRVILQGGVFEKVDYTGCCYRILGGSVSSDTEKFFRDSCKFNEKLNQVLLPGVGHLQPEILSKILLANFNHIDMCFMRKIKPLSYLPQTLKASGIIYGRKANGLRKLLLLIIGIKNIALLKYYKHLLTDNNYKKKLLKTSWREEENYE